VLVAALGFAQLQPGLAHAAVGRRGVSGVMLMFWVA